jgi:hypothetical protein
MHLVEYKSKVVNLGCDFRQLDQSEYWDWMQRWHQTFAVQYYASTGKWKRDRFNWYVFSYNHAPSRGGQKAIWEYQSQTTSPCLLLPDESVGLPGFRLELSSWPDLRSWYLDAYMLPESLDWTMAFTHDGDNGHGPYFCRREWVWSAPVPPEDPVR